MGLNRSQAFPSKFMSKDDVAQGPRRLVVADARMETIKGQDNGADEDKAVLYFQEADAKPMILNQTNWLTIEDAYGSDTDGWVGKPIEVYHDSGVMYGGKRTGGTRVRIPSGAAVNRPAATSPAQGGGLTFEGAIALAGTVGMSKEALIAALKQRGLAGYNAARDAGVVREIVALATPAAADASFDEKPDDAIPF